MQLSSPDNITGNLISSYPVMTRYHLTVWLHPKEIVKLILTSKESFLIYMCLGHQENWNQAHFEYLFKKNIVVGPMTHLFDDQKLPHKMTLKVLADAFSLVEKNVSLKIRYAL